MDALRRTTAVTVAPSVGGPGPMALPVTPSHRVDPNVPLGGTTQWIWGPTGTERCAATVGHFLAIQSQFNAALALVGWPRGEVDALSGLIATHGDIPHGDIWRRQSTDIRDRAMRVSLNPGAADDPLTWAVVESHANTLAAMGALSDLIVTLHDRKFTPHNIYTIVSALAGHVRIPIATALARAVHSIPAIPWHPDFVTGFVARLAYRYPIDVLCVCDDLAPEMWRHWGPVAIERLCILIDRQYQLTPSAQLLPQMCGLVAALNRGDARLDTHRVAAERRCALLIGLMDAGPVDPIAVSSGVDAMCVLEAGASRPGEHDATILAVLRAMAESVPGRPGYDAIYEVGGVCAALPAAIAARPCDRWSEVEWRRLLTDLVSIGSIHAPAAFARLGHVLPVLESLGFDHAETRNFLRAYFPGVREYAAETQPLSTFTNAAARNGWDPVDVKSTLLSLVHRHGMDADAILTEAVQALRVLRELETDPAAQVRMVRRLLSCSEIRSEVSEAREAMRALGAIGAVLVPVRGENTEKVRCVFHLLHTFVPARLGDAAEMLRLASRSAAFDGSIERFWEFIALRRIGFFLRTIRGERDALALDTLNLWNRCTTPERLHEALAEGLALLFLAGHRWDAGEGRRDVENIVPQWEGIANIPFAQLTERLELAHMVEGIQRIPRGPADKIRRVR